MKKSTIQICLFLSASFLFACNDDKKSGSDEGSSGDLSTGSVTVDTGTTAAPNNAGTMRLAATDSLFVMEAASGGMMEVEAGRMAEQNAAHARVKSFGTMMVRDHTNANNELKSMASGKGILLPDTMMSKHRQHLEMLRNKKGSAFDRQYMSMMNTAHNEDINKFQVASNNAQDAGIKGFATKTLPVLRMHKDSAQAVSSAIK